METFSFFIPNGVIAELGLVHDGQTVSREVRLCDLLADGQMTVNDYHALASAGVVVMPNVLFTFQSVEETAEGWVCHQIEPEPRAWVHTLDYLRQLFGLNTQWQPWLPVLPPRGFFYVTCLVKREQVERFEPYYTFKQFGVTRISYPLSEGIVALDNDLQYGENNICSQWVKMNLMRVRTEWDMSRPSFFQGATPEDYQFSPEDLERYYE